MESKHDYVIVDGGLGGALAVKGIRQRHQIGSVLLLARELHFPYGRLPISNQWSDEKTWCPKNNVELRLGRTVAQLDPAIKVVTSCSKIFAWGDNALFPGTGHNMVWRQRTIIAHALPSSPASSNSFTRRWRNRCETRILSGWARRHLKEVIYYLREGRVRGAMMCNVWGKVEEVRQLIRKDTQVNLSDLRCAIR